LLKETSRMGSPITTWEGAAAFFTYADRPGVIYAFLALSIIATVAAIVAGARHEAASYMKVNGRR
jgi:hypothetical protein